MSRVIRIGGKLANKWIGNMKIQFELRKKKIQIHNPKYLDLIKITLKLRIENANKKISLKFQIYDDRGSSKSKPNQNVDNQEKIVRKKNWPKIFALMRLLS